MGLKRSGIKRSTPEKIRAWRDRSARKSANNRRRTDVDAATYADVRMIVAERDGWRCQAVGLHSVHCDPATPNILGQAHHVKRISDGGTDHPENLIWVHADCHQQIHSVPDVARRLGLLN